MYWCLLSVNKQPLCQLKHLSAICSSVINMMSIWYEPHCQDFVFEAACNNPGILLHNSEISVLCS